MKKLSPLLSFLIFAYVLSKGQETMNGNTIDIVSHHATTTITKEHDVMVLYGEGQYIIKCNIKHGGKVQTHQAKLSAGKHFDKARFTWVSDNKVAVKLIAVNSSEELRILVWADNKRSTGMEVDTDLTAKL